MRKRTFTIMLVTALTLLLLSAGAVTWAQNATGFDLGWHVIGSGGTQSNSADYRVSGTVGQSTAGASTLSSADFSVIGGFWVDAPASTVPQTEDVLLPFIVR